MRCLQGAAGSRLARSMDEQACELSWHITYRSQHRTVAACKEGQCQQCRVACSRDEQACKVSILKGTFSQTPQTTGAGSAHSMDEQGCRLRAQPAHQTTHRQLLLLLYSWLTLSFDPSHCAVPAGIECTWWDDVAKGVHLRHTHDACSSSSTTRSRLPLMKQLSSWCT
jgi:hypothetical protein